MAMGIENVAIDLENFANHASRSTVTTDDVLLLARKNPDLQQLMREFVKDKTADRAPREPAGPSSKNTKKAKGTAAIRLGARR